MPEDQVPTDSAQSPRSRPDRITFWFLAAVVLGGLLYVCFNLTPSSYGILLEQLHAQDAGPIAGTSRGVRMDEWGLATPYFQAAVRNHFRRVNEASFYREDLRNFLALPLKDWSLFFKPQFWAFFMLPPATAYSIYYAFLMCAFLAGYHLLFKQLGSAAWLAACASVMVYFSGFAQFWWTTYGPLLAGWPWILLIVFSSLAWWKRFLLSMWAFPALALAHAYPTLLLTLVWGALILILAVRPSVLRSPGHIAALGAGTLTAAAVVSVYYADVIPIMRNTIYPGVRLSPPGGTSIFAALSEVFPFVAFRLNDYEHLTGMNICEMGAVGSFLPLLTLCLTRYRSLRDHAAARNGLLILLAGFTAITSWEIAPVPGWIGRILLWDTGPAERWMFTSGILLTFASLLIWSHHLISLHPFRITLFVVIGPVAAFLLKTAWLIHRGEPAEVVLDFPEELYLCVLAVWTGIAAWFIPAPARGPLLAIALAAMNIYGFSRFNPLQPAGPIFAIPETDVILELQKKAAASPEGILVDSRFYGATLNGLGFRSVSHILLAPRLELWRKYFPDMDTLQFNKLFNRYEAIVPTDTPMPHLVAGDRVEVPAEVFTPIRGLRQVISGRVQRNLCSQPDGGGIDRTSPRGKQLDIEGWAPWFAETDGQGIRVLSSRPLLPATLTIAKRLDIAASLKDYRLAKSGFKLRISAADGQPLGPEELTLFAFGTPQGEVRLACCACP